MVSADLKLLYNTLIETIARDAGYKLTADDYTRFDYLLATYGIERVIKALESLLGEDSPTFPSTDYVKSKIAQMTH
jgi:hypothetical protein